MKTLLSITAATVMILGATAFAENQSQAQPASATNTPTARTPAMVKSHVAHKKNHRRHKHDGKSSEAAKENKTKG